jgi:hypothetical protein
MKPSDEFFSFCTWLHQDFDLYGPTLEDWIDGALQNISEKRLPALREYVSGLLDGGYSDAELQEIYRATPTELRIWDNRGVRPFLQMVRDRIDRKLSR